MQRRLCEDDVHTAHIGGIRRADDPALGLQMLQQGGDARGAGIQRAAQLGRPCRSAVAQQEMQDKIFAAGHLVQPADGRKMVQRRPERQQLGCKCRIVHGLCWFSLYC